MTIERVVLAVLTLFAANEATPPAAATTGAVEPIVSTDWLHGHLNDAHVRVIVTGDRDEYNRAHIPGARFIDHMAMVGNGHRPLSVDAMAAALAKAGAADDAHVVIYGDTPMATGWLFMALASIGHGDEVSMLDGGLPLWRAEGRPTSNSAPSVGKDRLTVRSVTDVSVDAAWVRNHLESPDVRILDVRTTREWDAGHLPRATFVLWQDLYADLKTLKLKSPDQIRAFFAQAGVRPGQQVVTYCAVGMRASLMYWAARAVGLPARVYVGSFEDWRKDAANPIVQDRN